MKKSILLKISVFVFLVACSVSVYAKSTTVTDYVGGSSKGYLDGKSLESKLNRPYGLAMDKDGGLLFADSYNNRIRKVKDGAVTTIAGFTDKNDADGNSEAGFADGDALQARFNHPRDLAVDSKGNIYISDTGNNLIRKLSDGKVTTFAGSLKAGYKDGRLESVEFNAPSGIAVDKDDNIYVADTLNQVIRKITPKGNVTTFAGKNCPSGGYKDEWANQALFNEPSDIKIDKNGCFYIVDSGNQLIRKIEKARVSTVAGSFDKIASDTGYANEGYQDGRHDRARFNFPKGLDVAEDGTLFIADTWNHRIRAIQPDGNVITIAGNGIPGKRDDPLPQTRFDGPVDILYNSGNLYVSDMWNNVIRVIKVDLNHLQDVMDRSSLLEEINFKPKSEEIQVWMDKKNVHFPDAKPYYENRKLYLPLRSIFEECGAKVKYLESGQIEINKGSFYKILTLKKDLIFIKDGQIMMDAIMLAEMADFIIEEVTKYNAVVIST